MSKSTKDKALELRDEYLNLSPSDLSELKSEDKLLHLGFDLMKALAKQCTDEQWISFYSTGEVPAVRLSNEQMHALKGGAGFFKTWGDKVKGFATTGASIGLGVGRNLVQTEIKKAKIGVAAAKKTGLFVGRVAGKVSDGLSWAVNAGADAMCDAADDGERRIWGENDPWGLGKK